MVINILLGNTTDNINTQLLTIHLLQSSNHKIKGLGSALSYTGIAYTKSMIISVTI